jgi:ATP synthase protein I
MMKDVYRAAGSWGTLGLEIALCIGLGFFGGRWIDGKLGTEPWLAGLGFFFGLGAAGKAVLRTMKEMQAVTLREEREQGNPAPLFESRREREAAERGMGDEGSKPDAPAPTTPPERSNDEHT